jgi:hypothetical protein
MVGVYRALEGGHRVTVEGDRTFCRVIWTCERANQTCDRGDQNVVRGDESVVHSIQSYEEGRWHRVMRAQAHGDRAGIQDICPARGKDRVAAPPDGMPFSRCISRA